MDYWRFASPFAIPPHSEKIDILNEKVLELSGVTCIYENKSVFSYCDKCPLNSCREGTGTCNKVKSYSK